MNFAFDSRNRLTQTGSIAYRYDAENQRVGVNQTSYVVNSQPALSQVLVKEENGVKTFYVYGLGLIGEETGSEYTSYHFDLRGSTVALTNSTGQVTEKFQYSPYGVLLSGNAEKTPFLFNGMYGVMTDSNGLYYMRARFYSPEMRRFVNQDILLGFVEDGQTLNRYAFVTGRPVSFVDPFGLEKEITMDQLFDLFDKMWALDLAFNYPKKGCEARAHIMTQEMLKLGYNPYKVWLINFHNKLSLKGRNDFQWGFHVATMLFVKEETIIDGKVVSSEIVRWVIDPALFPQGPISLEDWKAGMDGIDHSSQSLPGNRPLILIRNEKGEIIERKLLPGSYMPFKYDASYILPFDVLAWTTITGMKAEAFWDKCCSSE